jgi:hypothetical protein
MIIEREIKQRVSLFVTGNYIRGSDEPGGYDEIENLNVYIGDVNVTKNFSFFELLRIEEDVILSIREQHNIQEH